MRYLTLAEVLDLHRRVMEQSGGSQLVRDLGALTSAVAQPRMTFEGRDLYLELVDKAAALGFSLISNHPFVEGTSESGTPSWRHFSCSTATSSGPRWRKRNASSSTWRPAAVLASN